MPRTATNAETSQKKKRSSICQTCKRKFRTSKDLALHILSKHGQVYIPTQEDRKMARADDTESVTATSPVASSNEVEEVQEMILDAQNRNAPFKKRTLTPFRRRGPAGVRKPSHSRSSWSSSESGSASNWSDDVSGVRRYVRWPRHFKELEETSTVEGESTGPSARDVYIEGCRSGRIALVPVQEPSASVINFAAGLF